MVLLGEYLRIVLPKQAWTAFLRKGPIPMTASNWKLLSLRGNCLFLSALLLALPAVSCSRFKPSSAKQEGTTSAKPGAEASAKKRVRIWNNADHDAVIEQASEAIQDDPNDADAYRRRAQAYWYKGAYRKAIADADKAISLKPDDAKAYFIRGNTFGHIGNDDRALQDYNEALRLAPDEARFYINRASIYQKRKEYKKALEDYNAAIRLGP